MLAVTGPLVNRNRSNPGERSSLRRTCARLLDRNLIHVRKRPVARRAFDRLDGDLLNLLFRFVHLLLEDRHLVSLARGELLERFDTQLGDPPVRLGVLVGDDQPLFELLLRLLARLPHH